MREVKIDLLLNNIILKLIEYMCPPKKSLTGRPKKCSNMKYLEAIFYVLKEGIGWEYLKGYPIKGDTVRKKFTEWTNLGIFQLSWVIMLDIYQYFKVDFDLLFIDASHIKNLLGIDETGQNVYDRFMSVFQKHDVIPKNYSCRKATKLTIITDDIGIPVSICLGPSNRHDITFVESAIEFMKIDSSSTKYLIGDKGYASTNMANTISNQFKIQLITPRKRRKGQKGRIRGRKPKGHEHLKKRFIVEHSFSWFKHYTRLFRRKDKLIKNFEGFIFIDKRYSFTKEYRRRLLVYLSAANIIAKKLKLFVNN